MTMRIRRRAIFAVAAVFLVAALVALGCAGSKVEAPAPKAVAPPTTMAETPLIPRAVLFGNPDKAGAKISPDGTRLSFLAPVDGVLNVWVGPAGDVAKARPVTHDTGRGVRVYFWAFTSRHLLYLQDKNGDENWRVYAVDLTAGTTTDLTPLDGVNAQIEGVSAKFPGEILVGLNDRAPQFHDLYRVKLATGERTLLARNDAFSGFVTDDDFRVRFAMRMTPDGGTELLAPKGEEWENFLTVPMADALTTGPAGFDKTGNVLYLIDSRGRNTAALAALDLTTGTLSVIAQDARADVSDVLVHPTEKTVQAVAATYDRKRWTVLDPSIRADLDFLRTVADGEIEVVDRTLDDRQWIVVYLLDDGPVRTYRYDRTARKAHFLFTNRKALEGLPLAKMRSVLIPARDGLELVSYLTLPVWSDSDGDGRPSAPLPMVLSVHGGPWSRDTWGYNPYAQWLANRGYAVLEVNFRGSTGLGKAFVNAANREWAGRMHDDLLDAVDWATKAGVAAPGRVAIMGGSYGGYATLVGLTFTPEAFACGVDIVGPSNLVTLLESIPPYWEPMIDLFATRVGDPRTPAGRDLLLSRSPLTRVDKIVRPLLIAQGANDPRVKRAESDQIVRAMQQRTIPVTYVLFPDEGHGFVRPQNNLAFNAATDAFLGNCLGGRVEPVGGDFAGSTITVPEGAALLPGLAEALAAMPKVETPPAPAP
jgi:dipeptidyl aminopeptidase/acylaminoacyl peptidase